VVTIMLLSHGPLAQSLVETARMILGPLPDVGALSIAEGMSPESLSRQLAEFMEQAIGEEVLILVDLLGGSPSNLAVRLVLDNPRVELVTGLNLPMLLEVLPQRFGASARELASVAEKAGKDGVADVRQRLRPQRNSLK
jgi:PTS system mannose-specific IIA component